MDDRRYKDESDEQLIVRIHDGNEPDIIDYIMNKYKNLVRKKAGSMYILGADRDDLIQEGMIGLFKAIRDYDIGRDANFLTFADLCVSRQMYSAIQASARKKHGPLNSYISIYAKREDSDTDAEFSLEDILESNPSFIPEEHLIEQENLKALEEAIDKELSPLEMQVLDLYVTGMSIKKISAVLGRDEKSTDNAMQRIRHKLKKYL
ncbi:MULTISPECIES: sigma-70 family RNA polymerase sigma factor [unclassified Butyrivibrio]|uniref:sigma-70 family RNA polymerase sigma factor n=1 Tax=unclassified Butyrivibrio TaxID=2639466 RepID=UPI0003B56197|nr:MULTISPECIES: sigma-70 family RNA polymerase sigma factor [unclassified Butyrivibrio]MDC7294115.1 sigma-70 family RNA polymerase sigma factor [Butyrivibrio sp. DSM 10294]